MSGRRPPQTIVNGAMPMPDTGAFRHWRPRTDVCRSNDYGSCVLNCAGRAQISLGRSRLRRSTVLSATAGRRS